MTQLAFLFFAGVNLRVRLFVLYPHRLLLQHLHLAESVHTANLLRLRQHTNPWLPPQMLLCSPDCV